MNGSLLFFSIGVFIHRHLRFTGQHEKRGDHLYLSLPLSPAHGYAGIYLQLCMWDDYQVFLFLWLVTTRLAFDETYPLLNYHKHFCLFFWRLGTRYLLQQFEIGNRWIQACIDCHRCFYSFEFIAFHEKPLSIKHPCSNFSSLSWSMAG